jgi:hypothetical protein
MTGIEEDDRENASSYRAEDSGSNASTTQQEPAQPSKIAGNNVESEKQSN